MYGFPFQNKALVQNITSKKCATNKVNDIRGGKRKRIIELQPNLSFGSQSTYILRLSNGYLRSNINLKLISFTFGWAIIIKGKSYNIVILMKYFHLLFQQSKLSKEGTLLHLKTN